MEHLMHCLLQACGEAPITDDGYWCRKQKQAPPTNDGEHAGRTLGHFDESLNLLKSH